jgi:hypothetical protein
MRRHVVMAMVGGLALLGLAVGRAEAQGAPPVSVTLSVLAGGQRFAFAPGTTGEAAVELPAGTPVLLSAAIEGNLTALGPYRLNIGPAAERGIAIGCNTPCTTTQMRVDGRNGDEFAARAVVLGASGKQVAASPVVRISWGRVAEGATSAIDSDAVDPLRAAVVLTIGVLLATAVVPLSLPKRW